MGYRLTERMTIEELVRLLQLYPKEAVVHFDSIRIDHPHLPNVYAEIKESYVGRLDIWK
jgi:hypothetical protein